MEQQLHSSNLILEDHPLERCIIIAGPPQAGKSCLAYSFNNSLQFPDFDLDHEESLLYKRKVKYNHKKYSLIIRDTMGLQKNVDDSKEEFFEDYILGVDGFIFTFSLVSKESFLTLQNIVTRIRNRVKYFVPMVFVGCKADLVNERQVTEIEAIKLSKYWDCPYIEISAKNAQNINSVFKIMLNEMERTPETDLQRDQKQSIISKFIIQKDKKGRIIFKKILKIMAIIEMIVGIAILICAGYTGVLNDKNLEDWITTFFLFNGFFKFTKSILGFYGSKYDSKEYLKAYLYMLPISMATHIVSLILAITDFSWNDNKEWIREQSTLLYSVNSIALVIDIFTMFCCSKEVKRIIKLINKSE